MKQPDQIIMLDGQSACSSLLLNIACVMCLVGIVCNNAKSAAVRLNNRISGLKFKVINRAYRTTTGHCSVNWACVK